MVVHRRRLSVSTLHCTVSSARERRHGVSTHRYKEGLYINILLHLESLVVDSIVEGVYVLKYVGPVKTEEEASNQIFWNHK